MARIPILGQGIYPDSSGLVYPTTVSLELTLTNVKDTPVIVMGDPSGADIGFDGGFEMPTDFSSTPQIRVVSIIDGAPAAAAIAAFGFRQNQLANNEAFDVAFETDTIWSATIGSSGSGHSDEDILILQSGTLTGLFAPGDFVPFHFFRDDSVDTFAGKLLIVSLELDYTAA